MPAVSVLCLVCTSAVEMLPLTCAVYSELSVPRTRRGTSEWEGDRRSSRRGVSRLSAPGAHINSLLADEAAGACNGVDKRASGGEIVVPVIQRVDSSGVVPDSPTGTAYNWWVWPLLKSPPPSLRPRPPSGPPNGLLSCTWGRVEYAERGRECVCAGETTQWMVSMHGPTEGRVSPGQ